MGRDDDIPSTNSENDNIEEHTINTLFASNSKINNPKL